MDMLLNYKYLNKVLHSVNPVIKLLLKMSNSCPYQKWKFSFNLTSGNTLYYNINMNTITKIKTKVKLLIFLLIILNACGYTIVPPATLNSKSPDNIGKMEKNKNVSQYIEQLTKDWENTLSPSQSQTDINTASNSFTDKHQEAPSKGVSNLPEPPSLYSEVKFQPLQIPEEKDDDETTVEIQEGDDASLSIYQLKAVEKSNQNDMEFFEASSSKISLSFLSQTPVIEEKRVKAKSIEEIAIEKLLKKATNKKPRKTIIIHAPDKIENLVILWNPNTLEALIFDAFLDEKTLYEPAIAAMKDFLRDRITQESVDIHPKLVRLLYEMAKSFGNVLYVTSGYRHPGNGTKPTSYHVKGMAADVKHPEVSGEELMEFAIAWGAGGVGLYPESNSIHVDVREKPYYWKETKEHKLVALGR